MPRYVETHIKESIMIKTLRWAGLAVAMVFGSAWAQPQVQLQEGKSDGVTWMAGGINLAELDALRERQKEHSLKLVFTLNSGNYTAGVDVKIADMKGRTVLEQSDTGPMLLAKLPRGSYTVTAVSEGRSQTRKVQVGDRLRTEYMRWAPGENDFVIQPGGGTTSRSAGTKTQPR